MPSKALYGTPLLLASTNSFQQDLAQLLCAQHLAVARSSLNAMLLDSRNLRNVYQFFGAPGSCQNVSSTAAASLAGQCQKGGNGNHGNGNGHNGHGHDHLAPKTRTWCVSAVATAPQYSIDIAWMNNSTQQSEMLSYPWGDGLVSEPLPISGPPPPC